MDIRQLLTQAQLNNFDESIALELIQKIEKGNIQDLSCFSVGVRAEIIVLIATALAKCPSLHTVDMSYNNLGQHGPATAENLTHAPNLHTVDMYSNNLGEHGPATAENLTHAPNLHTVNMGGNNLEEHGPATAENLAHALSLHTVDMRGNNLRQHGPATAENLAHARSLHTVNMSENSLGQYGPTTAENLTQSLSIHIVNMGKNSVSSAEAIEMANSFAYKDNPIKLGIEGTHRGPILKTISNDNAQMHKSFEQAMDDTFNNTPLALLGLMENYADFFIEFIE